MSAPCGRTAARTPTHVSADLTSADLISADLTSGDLTSSDLTEPT
ncbi:pentapeptide repeat-containing protein [Streptomyces sp. NPDC048290]